MLERILGTTFLLVLVSFAFTAPPLPKRNPPPVKVTLFTATDIDDLRVQHDCHEKGYVLIYYASQMRLCLPPEIIHDIDEQWATIPPEFKR